MKTEYKTEEYKATNGFLYLWVLLMLMIFSSILIGRWLNIPASIGVTWIICLFISPFVFEKKIKQVFTKRVLLEFDDSSFSITKYHLKNGIEAKQVNIKWSDMKSYKFYFSPDKNTLLTIYLRNGASKRWAFKDNKTSQEAIKGESLFNVFCFYIKRYNENKDTDKKITLNLGFFNSKSGAILLYSESVIIIFGFIFHLITHPQSSVFTLLMGFSLVFQQFLKRKQEKALYEKINMLD